MRELAKPTLMGECIAEVIGTGLFMFIGTACVAALVTTGAQFGQWEISIIWGLAVAIAIYAVGGVSGAHINPAVTLALATFMGFEWRKVPFFIIAQFIGSALGASLTYFLYGPVIAEWELAHHVVRGTASGLQTAGIFTTFANANISYFHAMLVEMSITALLMYCVLALTDDKNGGSKGILAGLFIGIVVAIIGASVGPLTGFAMNPARDFAPRLMIDMLGWGNVVMTGGRHMLYAWVPIVGPILGAQLGAFIYTRFVSPSLPANIEEKIELEQTVSVASSARK
ncbi:Glycerol uptake facilitator protein [Marinomonas spartinae]|uniref:Glycerol uptake facilitator protein n=1 Tax=Marinomonas spartinae TaxID=1792290 RepID=A0A1A8TGT7_9GAMM|nr:MIP/aquaporin family protein [Marinomonas spartinae]SBS31826.1 Glycerol uptake facilitator protein [Marinomonas spartinae]SBS34093.1 Glycerol uptake facilitator protein [Marinomonas spartinae]